MSEKYYISSKISNKKSLQNTKKHFKLLSPINHPKLTIKKLYLDSNLSKDNIKLDNKKMLNTLKIPMKKSFSIERHSKPKIFKLMNKYNPSNKILINCLDENQTKELKQKENNENLPKLDILQKNWGIRSIDDSPVTNSHRKDNYFNNQYKRPEQHANSLKVNNNDGLMFRIKEYIKESKNTSKFLSTKKDKKRNILFNNYNQQKNKLTFTNYVKNQSSKPIHYIDFDNSSKEEDKKENSNESDEEGNNNIKLKKEINISSNSSIDNEKEDEKIVIKSNFKGFAEDLNEEKKAQNNNNKIEKRKKNDNFLKIIENIKSEKVVNKFINSGQRFSVQQNQSPLLNNSIILSSAVTKPGINDDQEKTNQDSYLIRENIFAKDFHLYGIFDGHGENGHFVSNYISKFINKYYTEETNYLNIKENLPSSKINNENKIFLENYEQIIKKQQNDLDIKLISKKKFDISQSGSTCLLLFLTNETLICSNVGDSECYLFNCSKEDLWTYEPLSKIHKPSDEIEKKRILENGGEVHPYYDENGIYEGPDRIYVKKKAYPGLSLSRTIGDLEGKKIGIISDPDITIAKIEETSKFIVMASDGLWDVVRPYDVSRMVRTYFNKRDIDGACNALLKRAEQMWKKNNEERDDITILVIFIGKPNICIKKDRNILKKISENVNDENISSRNESNNQTPFVLNLD